MSWIWFLVAAAWIGGCIFGAWAAQKGYVKGARPDKTYQGKEN